MINIELKEFQEQCVDNLLENTYDYNLHSKIILKSPTGSGKTIILIAYIEKYLSYYSDTVFCWFTPGKGELEEQSKEKMEIFSPPSKTGDIHDILNNGFENGTTYFINWEMVNDKKNNSLKESERKNLYNHISDLHRSQKNVIVIIDEEHLNNTSKSKEIINALSPKCEIRVSATPYQKENSKFIEIDENDVINEGLITKYLVINKDLNVSSLNDIEHENIVLLEKADEIRKEIAKAYIEETENIRPLVLVQFPNMNDSLIEKVEKQLEKMGYTYENGLLACWFSAENKEDLKSEKLKKKAKCNIENINKNNGTPLFLLFKQALATGWDCPRAKILVKLRETSSETFEIQTLGRLRRMPKAKHYDKDILDCSYLYTFDEKYKEAVLGNGGIETKRLFLKKEAEKISLIKETRNNDASYVDEKLVREKIYYEFCKRYKLSYDFSKNMKILEENDYILGTKLKKKFLNGKFRKLEEIPKDNEHFIEYEYEVNIHKNGIDRQHVVNDCKKIIGLNYEKTFSLLKNFFLKGSGVKKYKILELSLKELTAFIINNEHKLKEDLIRFDTLGTYQEKWLTPKVENFFLPKEEYYRFSSNERFVEKYQRNVYKDYDTSMTVDGVRSICERLFEEYCEKNSNVKFFYKNGDSGQQYLSVVYQSNYKKQNLFYPDYIVELNDGSLWIIETKGGEFQNKSKNIDKQVFNKFEAIKNFAERYNYNFAFVRDRNGKLFYTKNKYSEEMNNEYWDLLENLF